MSLIPIKELFHYEKGGLQSSKCTPGDFDFITAAADWKTHNEYSHECEALIFAAAASGSLGRTHYVNGKFISSDLCFILTPKDPKKYPVDLKFYHLIFQAFKDEIVRITKSGTSKEAIGLTVFGKYKLPYFDIEKQQEVKEQFVSAQESTLGLDTELTHQLNLVAQLRQAFLREAMQGKLVSLNPNDEPASVLLKKIKAEKERLIKEKKIKKQKPLPPITEDEIPYEIPKNWVWCRLGEITDFITKGTTPKKFNKDSGIPYLKVYNIVNQKIDFEYKPQFVDKEIHDGLLNRSKVYPGDVIMNIVGPPLGKVAIIPDSHPEWNINQALAIFRPLVQEMNLFIYWYLCFGIEIKSLRVLGVAGQDNLSLEQCRNVVFPLPPFSDQQRIVAKLDELMAYCDELEVSIKESQQQNELLLQQVLREALEPKEKEVERV